MLTLLNLSLTNFDLLKHNILQILTIQPKFWQMTNFKTQILTNFERFKTKFWPKIQHFDLLKQNFVLETKLWRFFP